jgi:hypothetical protein
MLDYAQTHSFSDRFQRESDIGRPRDAFWEYDPSEGGGTGIRRLYSPWKLGSRRGA